MKEIDINNLEERFEPASVAVSKIDVINVSC